MGFLLPAAIPLGLIVGYTAGLIAVVVVVVAAIKKDLALMQVSAMLALVSIAGLGAKALATGYINDQSQEYAQEYGVTLPEGYDVWGAVSGGAQELTNVCGKPLTRDFNPNGDPALAVTRSVTEEMGVSDSGQWEPAGNAPSKDGEVTLSWLRFNLAEIAWMTGSYDTPHDVLIAREFDGDTQSVTCRYATKHDLTQ